MSTKTVIRWNLRQLMAENGMFHTTDLVEPLHQRGVEISRQMVHRVATKPPQRINLDLLAALCDILGCTPNDLLELAGREDQPYGGRRCARCTLRERLTEPLTDPGTGQIHTRLRPVFDELVNSERPQTGMWWLIEKKPGTGPRLLAQMARGEIEVSHDTFRALPSDRAHDYLRSLLVALGILPPFEIQIERMLPWIEQVVADLPIDQAALIRWFAHWHVLRGCAKPPREDRRTQTITNASRRRIRVAIEFLAFLDTHGANPATATQDLMERYQEHVGRTIKDWTGYIAERTR